jgi:predicted Zn finger-like uncharacterized protein
MKFTCDSCGAQYMIGDEKLGKRGVKVRCKKCSYVIILRPNGYQGAADKKSASADLEASTADMTPSLPQDAMGPTTPFQTPLLNGTDDALGTVSSDMGLSKEFAAMGFDEPAQPAAGSRSLNVNLEVNKLEPSFPDTSSPFADDGIGGSLDDDPKEDLESALAAALPRLQNDDDGDELTSVDKRPDLPVGAIPRDDEEEFEGATVPGHPDREPPQVAVLGATNPSDAFTDGEDDEAQQTRRLSYDSARGSGTAGAPVGPPWGGGPVPSVLDSDSLSANLNRLEKDELEDMHASLSESLGKEQSSAKKAPPPPERGRSAVQEAPRSSPRSNMASLNALAAAASSNEPLPPFVAPSTSAAMPMGANGGSHQDTPMLDTELKSAFDAMFSPAAAPTPAYQENVMQATTTQDSAPAELFRSAYNPDSAPKRRGSSVVAGEADRRATRVFDLEAMQQVQAEQDLAQRPVSVANGKKPDGDAPEWYVAINDEQVGPLTFADVRARWERQDVAPTSLCWKQGMPDWTAIKNVKELEALGDMDDKARTVVSRVEANDEADDKTNDEPPTIAHPDDDPRKMLPRATVETKDEPEEEPSWRPSAASALASLAAAELAEPAPVLADKKDVAVGRALPATSDALEKLLAGDSKTNSSPFGAGEQSSSAIRPLPKRTEIVSSVSLRDPIASRTRPSYVVPAAIVAGFLFLGVILFVALRNPAPPPAQQQVAMQQTQPAQQQLQPGQPVNVNAQQIVQPGQPQTAQPGQVATGTPGEQPVQQPSTAQQPGQQALVAQQPAEKTVESGSGSPEGEALAVKDDAKPSKEPRQKKAPRERESKESKEERAPKREEKKERQETVAASKEPDVEISDEDDLLGGPKKKTRVIEEPSNDLPKQLEDSDILGELRKHKNAIQSCRQKQSTANAGLEGTMTVTFVIEGNGKTKRHAVEPEKFKTSVVGKCVIDAVKTWTFPKFSGRPMPVDFPVRVGGK